MSLSNNTTELYGNNYTLIRLNFRIISKTSETQLIDEL
jgi:hypothetical protein